MLIVVLFLKHATIDVLVRESDFLLYFNEGFLHERERVLKLMLCKVVCGGPLGHSRGVPLYNMAPFDGSCGVIFLVWCCFSSVRRTSPCSLLDAYAAVTDGSRKMCLR